MERLIFYYRSNRSKYWFERYAFSQRTLQVTTLFLSKLSCCLLWNQRSFFYTRISFCFIGWTKNIFAMYLIELNINHLRYIERRIFFSDIHSNNQDTRVRRFPSPDNTMCIPLFSNFVLSAKVIRSQLRI